MNFALLLALHKWATRDGKHMITATAAGSTKPMMGSRKDSRSQGENVTSITPFLVDR